MLRRCPAKKGDDGPQRSETRWRLAIDRPHRHLADGGAKLSQVMQHVGFEEVAFRDPLEGNLGQHGAVDRGEAVVRIEELPVAGGELGEEGQGGIADQAQPGHRRHVAQPVEAVALDVIGAALADRTHEPRDERRVHLPIAAELDDDIGASGERGLVAGDGRAAHPEILFMA